MRAIFVLFFGLLLGTTVNAQVLFIFGGDNQDVFLGCLNCEKIDRNSIWNEFGQYGSNNSLTSIWNKYGDYGGDYSDYSPFNKFASHPPVLLDPDGNFYGYFTVDEYAMKRTTDKLALLILENWDEISDDVGAAYDTYFKEDR